MTASGRAPLPDFECPAWCTADHELDWTEVTQGAIPEDQWSPIHESTVYSLETSDSCVTFSQLIRDGVAKIALDADAELTYEQARALALKLLAAVEPQQAA